MSIDPFYMVLIIALSVFAGLLLATPTRNLLKNFRARAPIIKKYWAFVIPFLIVLTVGYVLIFRHSSEQSLANNLTLVGQISGLIFAVFVGYFAFLQVVEYRRDKLKDEGFRYIKAKSYNKAVKNYTQVCSITSDNFEDWAVLLELYVIQKNFISFDEKISTLKKNQLDSTDHLVTHYLIASRYLFDENLPPARNEIINAINYEKSNPTINPYFWDYSDIKTCEAYTKLTGDPKKIFDNFIAYLTNGLTPENKIRFEGGDFLL